MTKRMYHTSSKKWNDKNGSGVHNLKVIVEFEGCAYRTVEIVSESGRPEGATPLTTTGAVAERFINNAAMLKVLGYSEITD